MEIRAPKGWATCAAASLVAYATLAIVNVVAGIRLYPAPPGGARWPDHATTLGWVNMLLGLFSCAATCIWFYHATAVAQRLSPAMKFTPKRAVLWLLVPIANLLMAPLVVGDLWTASSTEADKKSGAYRLLAVWMIAWVAMPIFAWGGRSRPTVESDAIGAIVSWAFAVVASITMAAILIRVTAMQAERLSTNPAR